MNEPLEEAYFIWLCAKVSSNRAPIHHDLLTLLHTTEFVWVVAMDENRAEDGRDLRNEFLIQTGIETDPEWYECPCSVLEMLIAFSRRAAFQTDWSPKKWFRIFLKNLELYDYRRVSDENRKEICDILDTFIWRSYGPDGRGGLFPIEQPKHDQRQIEIWYQFCEYVEDQRIM